MLERREAVSAALQCSSPWSLQSLAPVGTSCTMT